MIASSDFSRSPQLGAFLQFVVDAVLNGQSAASRPIRSASRCCGDTKFDPQLDPIVRVKATRLRRTIDRYYAGAGSDDPIRISLPRGSYAPTFSRPRRISRVGPAAGVAIRFSSAAQCAAGVRRDRDCCDRDRGRRIASASSAAGCCNQWTGEGVQGTRGRRCAVAGRRTVGPCRAAVRRHWRSRSA